MKTSRRVIGLLAGFLLAANGPSILAQFAPPTGAMDTLSEMSTGAPGGAPAPAGPPPMPGAAAPAAAPGAMPGNMPGGMTPEMMQMMMMGGMPPGMAMPGIAATATATATPTPKRYPALRGQRIYDAVSYRKNKANAQILDDVYRVEISEDEVNSGEYFDDGNTQGDAEQDGVYSNILPESTNDWIGGDNNFYLERIVAMLQNAEQMDPLDFFGVQAMTTEEFSRVPNERAKVQEQMAKISSVDKEQFSGWAQTFLKDYRVDQQNRTSKFFPLYIPRYPEPPTAPPPPAPWRPYGHPDLMAAGALQGGVGAFPGGMNMNMMMMQGMMPGGAPTPVTSFDPIGRARGAANTMAAPR